MSLALREVLTRSNHDLEFRSAILDGDLSVVADVDLNADEVSLLRNGDENAIYRYLGDTRYFHIREQGTYDEDPSH